MTQESTLSGDDKGRIFSLMDSLHRIRFDQDALMAQMLDGMIELVASFTLYKTL